MNSKQSNNNQEIINKTLIVSYFLIFTLVIMTLFMVKILFFNYTADQAVSYQDYTGSIHVGIDTVAGDYYLQSTSNNQANYVYGIRDDEDSPFTIMTFTNNQIIQVENGQHLIFYKANVTPLDETKHSQATSALDGFIDEKTISTSENVSSEVISEDAEGMLKLTNQYYNMPFVVAPNGENPYLEYYDQDLNVTNMQIISNESLHIIGPTEASYVKANDVEIASINDYTTTGSMAEGYFTPAVYLVGSQIETGEFLLEATSSDCQYRVIKDTESVAQTPLMSCPANPQVIELSEGQIIEFTDGKLTKYYGDIDVAEYNKGAELS